MAARDIPTNVIINSIFISRLFLYSPKIFLSFDKRYKNINIGRSKTALIAWVATKICKRGINGRAASTAPRIKENAKSP